MPRAPILLRRNVDRLNAFRMSEVQPKGIPACRDISASALRLLARSMAPPKCAAVPAAAAPTHQHSCLRYGYSVDRWVDVCRTYSNRDAGPRLAGPVSVLLPVPLRAALRDQRPELWTDASPMTGTNPRWACGSSAASPMPLSARRRSARSASRRPAPRLARRSPKANARARRLADQHRRATVSARVVTLLCK